MIKIKKRSKSKYLQFLILGIITLVSTYLRLNTQQYIVEGSDDWVYHQSALNYLSGQPIQDYYRPQGMSIFLYINYLLFGTNMKFILILIGILSSVLIYLIAAEITGNKFIAATAFAISLFDPDLVFYSVQLYSENVYTFLVLLAVYFTLKAGRKWSLKYPVLIGICIGLGLYQKVYTIGLLPAMLLYLGLNGSRIKPRLSNRQLAVFTLIVLMTTALIVAPRIIKIYSDYGVFVFMASISGENLFVGNNPYSTGCYTNDGLELNTELIEKTMPYMDSPLKKYYIDKAAGALAVKYITGNPMAFASKLATSFGKFWLLPNVYCSLGSPLPGYYLNYKVLLWLLTITGIFLSLRYYRRYVLAYVWCLVIVIVTLVTYYESRYVHPIIPFQIIFSAYAIYVLYSKIDERFHSRRTQAILALIIALAIFCTIFRPLGLDDFHNSVGIFYYRMGDIDKAASEFNASLKYNPRNVNALLNLGTMYYLKGDLAVASSKLKEALVLDPGNVRVHNALGAIYLAEGQYNESETELKKAISTAPYFGDAHNTLGAVYYATGRYEQAVSEFEKALEIKKSELTEVELGPTTKNLEKAKQAEKKQVEQSTGKPATVNPESW